MKNLKLNRYLRIALGIFCAVMLFVLGAHGSHQEGVTTMAAAGAVVTLSDDEKAGLSEDEQKVVLGCKKAMVLQLEEFKRGTIDSATLDARIKALKDGLTAAEFKALTDKLEEQGNKLTELQGKLENKPAAAKSILQTFKDDLDEAKDELADIRKNRSGSKAFTLKDFSVISATKAAAVTMTVDPGAGDASIVEQGSASALLRLGDGPIYEIQRGIPFILNFVSVGQTDAPALIWFDEVASEGAFAVVAEGALKPLVQYKFERRTAEYRKAAGYTVITDEFTNDFPRLVSTINRLMRIDVRNKMNALILADMITAASSYTYSGLDDLVDNADDYAAIGAAIAQLQTFFYTPNVLVLNPADAWRMRLTKSTGDGQYLMPPFTWNGTTYEFGRVIVDPAVTAGNFFVGDGSVYQVDLKGEVIVRVGYANDDFIRNQYSMVVEQYFYNYISNARKSGLIYGNFATIKAAIEKP